MVCPNERFTWLRSASVDVGAPAADRRTSSRRHLNIGRPAGWEANMSDTVTDDHGHEHPKHELGHYAKRIYAIRDLLIEKGVITEKDIQCQIEYQEARTPANGAKLVARAWVDPEFKKRFVADPKAASPRGIDQRRSMHLSYENLKGSPHGCLHSCFLLPASILGRPPDLQSLLRIARQRSSRFRRVRLELSMTQVRCRHHR